MAVADTQVLGELVDCADVAVRAAGQLHLFRRGRQIRDKDVLARAVDFLAAAEAGGAFMSSGDSANLNATLRPLNWAADARTSGERRAFGEQPEQFDYEALTHFLQRMQSIITQVSAGIRPDDQAWEECIGFLDCLGETLGMRADQQMRAASTPLSSVASF